MDEEVLVAKDVTIHRLHIKGELLQIFSQPDILDYDVRFIVLDLRGDKESGKRAGVTRDVLCLFWEDFLMSSTIGYDEVVPSVRHDMTKYCWEAVGRILLLV